MRHFAPFSRINRTRVVLAGVALAVIAMGAVTAPAGANHSWNGYHWARAQNPFTLKLTDHVDSTWDGYLAAVSSDWSASQVLDTAVVPSFTTSKCKAVAGRVEVCNRRYGRNGWLGISQIWISGTHITASTVRVNDTYFGLPQYNSAAARQSVMCMEVGHSLGLDHQDGVGDSCMDDLSYDWPNIVHPNAHDYAQLATIYSHLDATTTVARAARLGSTAVTAPRRVSRTLYVENLGNGRKLFTWVTWKSVQAAARASDRRPPL
ncbi:MAG: hypothetical protein AABM29_10635 [Actinomycetota bacterium]